MKLVANSTFSVCGVMVNRGRECYCSRIKGSWGNMYRLQHGKSRQTVFATVSKDFIDEFFDRVKEGDDGKE